MSTEFEAFVAALEGKKEEGALLRILSAHVRQDIVAVAAHRSMLASVADPRSFMFGLNIAMQVSAEASLAKAGADTVAKALGAMLGLLTACYHHPSVPPEEENGDPENKP